MAGKRSKTGKSSTRKKTSAARGKAKRPPSTPPHNPYEDKIYDAVNDMLTATQAIFKKLTHYDKNSWPTAGIITMIQELISEFEKGDPDQATHDSNIEQCLYAIAGIDDQYNIDGSPDIDVQKPTGNSHEENVAELLTTIDTITRAVLNLLDSTINPGVQPEEEDYDSTEDFIVALADDTKDVVALIRHDIHAVHGSGRYSIFSK